MKWKMDDILEQYESNKHETINKYIIKREHHSEYVFKEISH